MDFIDTTLDGAYQIRPGPCTSDSRGSFARVFCAAEMAARGLEAGIRQINVSRTKKRGALRGMHFQRPPMAEVKMVRCTRGAVFDVAVDLRAGSPGFGHWHGVELSAAAMNIFYIPRGCAHGFQALTDDVELLYCMSADYSPEHEGGLRYDDPLVAIRWPLEVSETSARDLTFPGLIEIEAIEV